MTTRDDILSAVSAALAGIKTASGYSSNLGSNVYDWDAMMDVMDRDFTSSIFMLDESYEYDNEECVTADKQSMTLLIKIIPGIKDSKIAILRNMRADVNKALKANEDSIYAAGAQYIKNEKAEYDLHKESLAIIGMTVKIRIEFITPKWE